MRRPLIGFCFAEALGILLAYYEMISLQHLCTLCAGAFLVAAACRSGRKRLILAILVFLVLGYVSMYRGNMAESDLARWDGQVAEITGVVTKVEVKERCLSLTVFTELGGPVGEWLVAVREKVLLQLECEKGTYPIEYPYSLTGKKVRCTGRLALPDGRRTPGGFDYRLYLRGRNIHMLLRASRFRFEVFETERHFLHGLSLAKGKFLGMSSERMSPEGFAMLAGLLFGEKNYIQEDVYEGFRESGMGHIFAVSGLHVGLLYAVLLKLSDGWRRDRAVLLMISAIFIYAMLANFSSSVMRASFMALAAMLARTFRGRYDLISSASAAALLLMTIRPCQLFDSGFQLSFLAAYSIGVALPVAELRIQALAERQRKAWITSVGNVVAPCVVIQAGMAPLIAFHFLIFAPAGFFVNPPALLLAGILLPAGLLMFLISLPLALSGNLGWAGAALSEILFPALTGVAECLSSLLMKLSLIGQSFPGGGLRPAPPLGMMLVFYGLYFLCFSETKYILLRRKKYATLALLTAACLAVAIGSPRVCGISDSLMPWTYNTPLVTFLDVGQGDCIHIRKGDINILVDGGGSFYKDVGKTILQPYLLKNGVAEIDIAFVTHGDLDHRKGIQDLSCRMPVNTLALSYPYCNDPGSFSDISAARTVYLSAGDSVQAGEDLLFQVLGPEKSVSPAVEENEKSLVMMLDCDGLKLLLTGDVEYPAENRLKGDMSCDILKVSHHGSAGATETEFLEAASPGFAAISCGRNNTHGHPAPRVIELLEKSGIMIGRTDQQGSLCLRSITPGFFFIENAARDRFWTVARKDFE